MKDFREKTVTGVAWSALSQGGRQLAVLVSNVSLARLLTPRDFGVIATVLIFSNFAFVIAELGFNFALIQRETLTEDHLSSTFWLNAGTGLILMTAFLLGAPLLARSYHEPVLIPVTQIVAFMFLIYPMGMVHKALLNRKLEFRSIATVEVASAWIGGIVAVALAWFGAGVYAIAAQFIVEFVTAAVALWTHCDWRPKFLFRLQAIADLSGFSFNLLGESILGYWVRNVDNLLIGLYYGAFQLGLYSRAYAVMLFPLSRVSWVFGRVMMRSFAIIKDDRERVRTVFLKMTRVIALITFPMMLGVAASARPFVLSVFGPQWEGMVPVLRLLAAVGMVESVTSMIGSIYLSHGETRLSFRVSLVSHSLRLIGIVAGLRWGIFGVACGYAIAAVVCEPIETFFGGRLIGVTVFDFLWNLKSLFLTALTMALAVAGLDRLIPAAVPAVPRFAALVLTGAALYWGLLVGCGVQGYAEFLELVRERLTPGRKA